MSTEDYVLNKANNIENQEFGVRWRNKTDSRIKCPS